MKKCLIVMLLLLYVVNGYAQPLTADEKITLETWNKEYSRDFKTASLNYAWLLYRSSDENCSKADSVLVLAIAQQDQEPGALTYGHWNWSYRDGEKYVDWNNALFQAHILFCGLWDQQPKMSAAARTDFLASCQRMVEAAHRRWDYEIFDITRDHVAYSNVFAMYIQAFALAADRFNNPRFKRIARDQWARWYNHISFFGIDEFASPTYNKVIFNALLDIREFIHDERIQKEATEVMDHIYLLQSAITHPLLKLPVCGISRDYRNFTTPGDARSGVLTQQETVTYAPPKKAIEINENRKYPFEVTGKATFVPFVFTSYQLENAAMGTMTGGAVFQQQVHCMIAAGKNENERAVAFMQGSYTPVNGYTDQSGTTALCVYNRLPTLWHLTQKHGFIDPANYREAFGDFGIGITNWKEISRTADHILLNAYEYDLHLFPFRISNGVPVPCDLAVKHRTTTSPRYHPRPRNFEEYVFPDDPDWFGMHVVLVKAGTKVIQPRIEFTSKEGITTISTNQGHTIRLFTSERGDTRQLYRVDPLLIPIFQIKEK